MTQRSTSPFQYRTRVGFLVLAGLLLLASLGCTRRFYRNWADREVAGVLEEKDVVPDWKIENYHVYPDSRARFADPDKPDRPPMPPDDPAARALAPNPQRPKHAGVGFHEGAGYLELLAAWDAHNRGQAAPASGPETIQQTSLTQEKGPGKENYAEPPGTPRKADAASSPGHRPYLITLEQAVELGLINSREFQARRENLYLAVLPVTQERFSFAFQSFAIGTAIREYTGELTGFGKGDHWRFNTTTGFTKLFPRGALLLFAFANRTVVDLSGRTDLASVSTMNLDFIQPLLLGGGRAVTLEPLTQIERNLVYEIRDYARFRKQYFQYISGGGDLGNFQGGVSAFGRAFAPGTVTLDSGNPARPGVVPRGAGVVNLTVGTVAPSEGYLPTEQKKGFIAIQQRNVERLVDILKLFQAYEEGGEVSSLQVGQVQLQLLDAQAALLQNQQDYSDSLEGFKLQLGVPPSLPLELADDHIRPLLDQYDRFETALSQFESAVKQLERFDAPQEAPLLRERIRQLLTQSPLVKDTVEFKKGIEARWQQWFKDRLDDKAVGDKLSKLYAERRRLLDLKALRAAQDITSLAASTLGLLGSPFGQGPLVAAPAVLEQVPRTLTPDEERRLNAVGADISLGEMERELRQYEKMPWAKEAKERDRRERHVQLFRVLRTTVVEVLGEARNERTALLRLQWPHLPGIDIGGVDMVEGPLEPAYEVGEQLARENRLDLMNARAQLVDAWRQVAVYANSLLGGLNVGYHMDSSTPPDEARPLAFQPQRTRHQLILNTELPLVRLAERNNYRAALIAYQRARRALMAAEDQVAAQIRAEVRQLQVLVRTARIQQQSVELNFQQVENALEQFRAPQAPGAGAGNAGTVAALTQQLLNAYGRLPQSQNRLLAIWTQYLVARQQLYLDLELMRLDSRGVWIDELSNRLLDAAGRDALGQSDAQPNLQPAG